MIKKKKAKVVEVTISPEVETPITMLPPKAKGKKIISEEIDQKSIISTNG